MPRRNSDDLDDLDDIDDIDDIDDADEYDDEPAEPQPRRRSAGRGRPGGRGSSREDRVAAATARAQAKSRQRTIAGAGGAIALVLIFGGRFALRYMARAGAQSQVQGIVDILEQAPVEVTGDDRFQLTGLNFEVRKKRHDVSIKFTVGCINVTERGGLRPHCTVHLYNTSAREVAFAKARGTTAEPGEGAAVVARTGSVSATTLRQIERIEVEFHRK